MIAAGEAARSPESLPFGVRELIDAADEILVVTPSLPTRFEWLASATDRLASKQTSAFKRCSDNLTQSVPRRPV